MSDELLIGLAGGAIGAFLTGLLAQAGRAWAAWGEVSLHDEEAAERNERLVVWVDDRTRELLVEIRRRSEDYNSRGLLYSGAHGGGLAAAKVGPSRLPRRTRAGAYRPLALARPGGRLALALAQAAPQPDSTTYR